MNFLKLSNIQLPKKNKSIGSKIKRADISPELISDINEWYQQDFDFWREWSEKIDVMLTKLK